MNGALPLAIRPVHLGAGAVALPQPEFPSDFAGTMAWYEDYGRRTEGDGAEGRLVSMHSFSQDWDSWEMHPQGDELVVCVAGRIVLVQELADGSVRRIELRDGDYAINPPGTWHTADVAQSATALFITAGMGTQGRPR